MANDAAEQKQLKKEKKSILRRPWMWPLLPYFIVRWIAAGGIKWLWDEFLCFFFLDFDYDQDGNPKKVYFLEMHPFVHFHPLSWGGYLMAAILVWKGPEAAEAIGLTLMGLLIYCGLTVTIDLPFKRFLVTMAILFIVIPLADYGLAMGAKQADEFLTQKEWPALLFWAERGILVPLKDYLSWLDTAVHAGWLVLFSTVWTLVVAYHLVISFLDNRYGFDGERLYRWKFGESEDSHATYYEDTRLIVPDILESIFGFAAIKIGVEGERRGPRYLRNICFLALPGRRSKVNRIIAKHAIEPGDTENSSSGGVDGGKVRNNHRVDPDALPAS